MRALPHCTVGILLILDITKAALVTKAAVVYRIACSIQFLLSRLGSFAVAIREWYVVIIFNRLNHPASWIIWFRLPKTPRLELDDGNFLFPQSQLIRFRNTYTKLDYQLGDDFSMFRSNYG